MALKSLGEVLEEARKHFSQTANVANLDALLECVRRALFPVKGGVNISFSWDDPDDGSIMGSYRAYVYCRPDGEDADSFKSSGKYVFLYVGEGDEEGGNFDVGIIALRGDKVEGVFITAEDLPTTVNLASLERREVEGYGRFIAIVEVSDPILQAASEGGATAQ